MSGKIPSQKMKCNLFQIEPEFLISNRFYNSFFHSVNITYVGKDGKRINIRGKVGDNAMYLAHRYDIPLEGEYKNYTFLIFYDGLFELNLFKRRLRSIFSMFYMPCLC